MPRQSFEVELAIVHHEAFAIAHNIENVLSVLCREPLRIFALQFCNSELVDPLSLWRNVVPWQEVPVKDLRSLATDCGLANIFRWQSNRKFDYGQLDDLRGLLADILVRGFSIEGVPRLLLECCCFLVLLHLGFDQCLLS